MPMRKIGGFSLAQLAVICAGFAAPWVVTSPARAQAPASFETFAARAVAAREAGRTDEAIKNYRAAVELRPSWDEGWWYLGTLLYDTDRFGEAIPALRQVVEMHPKAGPAWAFLGLSQFETGDYAGALTALRTAREIGFSESPDVEKVALYHLALLLNQAGEFEAATALLTNAFGPSHFTPQIKAALGLALLRAPVLPSQADPSQDALFHAAGETAVLLANRQSDAALRNFEQMLRDYPDTPFLHYQYGTALAALARYPEAEFHFREEIRITPRSAAPWKGLAQALQAQNKLAEATSAAKRGQELAQVSGEVDAAQARKYALNRGGVVAKPSDSSISAGGDAVVPPAENFEAAAQLAEAERRAGRLEQATAAYQNALNLRPGWPDGWRQLGTIAYMQARYPDAISAFRQSVALDSKQPDAWTLLGLSEFHTRDYKNALIHLEHGRVLGFSGNAAAVRISRYHLALLLNLNGRFDQALDVLIPEVAPGSLADEIQFAMGIALLRIPVLPEQVQPDQYELIRKAGESATLLSESRYDKAFPILEKLLSDYPSTRFLHYAYGDALAGTSMFDEAQAQLLEEARVNPESALPYIRLASIALQLHHSSSALEHSKKAVALAPESAEGHYWLGRSLLDEGEIPAAIRELETARRYAPNSPKVRFNLARAYSKGERPAEAEQERAEFERLNALLPGQQKSYGDRVARGFSEETRSDR